ncbi:bifunctional riboflavin kinase/FAD synthetase [Mesonia sp. K7]|uniref:bifunctional riboflavin kinase/FAD synthetase n=1 Tax=Mesonia sp. K7 TaxID=2218606 RepID=UPI000DA98A0C|nr:bifunctional riboflavin kinase/FAD synthetase [Mesonia sp. K7]PZD78504.1 riboflavin biosynthesis protein RibF [Mesonia sp. K7]
MIEVVNKSVVTIGTFDGVHIGHQKILSRLIKTAKKENLDAVVLTFFPHPRMVLQKDVEIKLINTIDERIAILKSFGVDEILVYPFSHEFSRLTAREYVEEILVKKLKAKKVIIGYDHRFGRNRAADINDLKQLGKEFRFTVEEISKQDVDEVAVSSTKIRKAILEGDFDTANKYLGKPFVINGKVEKGESVGKKLGFPTANIKISESYKIIPKKGVYVVQSQIEGKNFFGMMNIGNNPTFENRKPSIEVYFLHFDGNLYDKSIQIEVLTRIRDEKKFHSVELLVEAMQQDLKFTENYIQNLNND